MNLVHSFASKEMDEPHTLEGLRYRKVALCGEFANESVVRSSGILGSPGVLRKHNEVRFLKY